MAVGRSAAAARKCWRGPRHPYTQGFCEAFLLLARVRRRAASTGGGLVPLPGTTSGMPVSRPLPSARAIAPRPSRLVESAGKRKWPASTLWRRVSAGLLEWRTSAWTAAAVLEGISFALHGERPGRRGRKRVGQVDLGARPPGHDRPGAGSVRWRGRSSHDFRSASCARSGRECRSSSGPLPTRSPAHDVAAESRNSRHPRAGARAPAARETGCVLRQVELGRSSSIGTRTSCPGVRPSASRWRAPCLPARHCWWPTKALSALDVRSRQMESAAGSARDPLRVADISHTLRMVAWFCDRTQSSPAAGSSRFQTQQPWFAIPACRDPRTGHLRDHVDVERDRDRGGDGDVAVNALFGGGGLAPGTAGAMETGPRSAFPGLPCSGPPGRRSHGPAEGVTHRVTTRFTSARDTLFPAAKVR